MENEIKKQRIKKFMIAQQSKIDILLDMCVEISEVARIQDNISIATILGRTMEKIRAIQEEQEKDA